MLWQLSGAFQDRCAVAGAQGQLAGDGQQRMLGNHARAQQLGRSNGEIQHGGFDADLGLAAINDQRDLAGPIFSDMLRGGR